MKRNSPDKLSKERTAVLEKRMLAYALGAAGAMLAVQPATASVIFTSTHQTISRNSVTSIDLNLDGSTDFILRDFATGSAFSYVSHLTVSGGAGGSAKVIGKVANTLASAWAAPAGWPIGPKSPKGFVPVEGQPAQMLAGHCLLHCYSQGLWRSAKDKYLGFQFTVNGEIHYGWARLSAHLQKTGLTAILTGYAYETQPDTVIVAGDRGFIADVGAMDVPTNEPTLALLSLGSTGLDVWRRNSTQVTSG